MSPILAVSFALVSLASQPDTQKRGKAANRRQDPAPQQRGTDSLPVTVKLLNTGKSQQEAAEESKRVQAELDDAKATLLWVKVTGGATVVLAFFTFGLWFSTKKLATDAKASSERQLRAYVAVRDFPSVVYPSPENPTDTEWELVARYRNAGLTPARKTDTSMNFRLFPQGGLPPNFGFPDNAPPGAPVACGVLGPKCEMNSGPARISHASIEELRRSPDAQLYIWGWITYSDVFPISERRRTEFAARLIPHGDAFRITIIDRHNDAT